MIYRFPNKCLILRAGLQDCELLPGQELSGATDLGGKKVNFSFISAPSSVKLRAARLKASPFLSDTWLGGLNVQELFSQADRERFFILSGRAKTGFARMGCRRARNKSFWLARRLHRSHVERTDDDS